MKNNILLCLVFILFIGITLLPATLATEKEAVLPDDPEPLNQTITYRGFVKSENWIEDKYPGYTFIKPIFVINGYDRYSFLNCDGIGIPDEDFDESTYSLFYQPLRNKFEFFEFIPVIMPGYLKLHYMFTLGSDEGPIIL